MIKIMLADDHVVMREGMRMMIESCPKFEVIFEASNGKQILDAIALGQVPDLLISDISMQEMDGIEMLESLKKSHPNLPVLIISMLENEAYLYKALAAGAKGFLSKSIDSNELFFALNRICAGERYISSDWALRIVDSLIPGETKNPESMSNIEFSTREIELIKLIADGFTNLEISNKVFLSKRTIEGQRQAILDKTGTRNTASLMRYVYSNGILK